MVALPILAGAAFAYPEVQLKAYCGVQAAARQHWGHVATPGYVYRLLDERFYPDRSEIADIEFRESAKFVARAIGKYLTVPLPWEVQSRPALAYVPEQIVWYILVVLASRRRGIRVPARSAHRRSAVRPCVDRGRHRRPDQRQRRHAGAAPRSGAAISRVAERGGSSAA